MMELSEANFRTPFSGEQGRQVQPLSSDTKRDIRSSPEIEPIENMSLSTAPETQAGSVAASAQGVSLGSGAAVQQPKVQTAFIHKLYNMLEDSNIQHLISWSSSNESFVVSPTGEFSKVLSQYFKHTNISSFVRQLNMYGFHKVNDVFHTGSPDSTLWEFKHGNGSFKRGDLVGLREIKRRASRHALIHRDSFSGTKSTAASAPGTPSEQPQDAADARLVVIEQTLFDLTTRLARAEENNAILAARYQAAMDTLSKCQQWTLDLAHSVTHIFPSDSPALRDIQTLQREIERHSHMLEEPQEYLRDRQPFPAAMSDNNAPLSPRQRPAEDDSRRSSFSGQFRPGGYFRPPAPPHLANPPRRYGSAGLTGSSSPNSLRPQPAPQPPPQHPLATYQSPPSHLSRRHTSADIRQHGWQASSPFSGIGQYGPHWPPSPNRPLSTDTSREVQPGYDIQQHRAPNPQFASQTASPFVESMGHGPEGGWAFGNGKFPLSREAGHTAPPTRRSSLASSSVHALLNPPENAMDRGGVSDGEPDDRKRKRLS